MTADDLAPFDALILMSFGGPETEDDVLPFLKNVTEGRGIPDERLVEVGEHYYGFGGKSPINDQNRALLAALKDELRARKLDIDVLWGNRNWEPYLEAVTRQAAREGKTRFIAIDTSAYSSYSSCRQYREDFAGTVATLADDGITVAFDKIRQYYNHPGFAAATLDCLRAALTEMRSLVGELDPARHRVLFVTHSVPEAMQRASEARTEGYRQQHELLIEWLQAQLTGELPGDAELVYCSRSGAPHVPWLEPDVNDRLEELAAAGVEGVVLVPIGFVSDHMEVKYDLDTEAKATAERLGLAFVRAATVGVHHDFIKGLVDLVLERAAEVRGQAINAPAVTGKALQAGSGACSVDCCLGRTPRPVAPQWPDQV